jgi:hypothetical protein
MPLLDGPSLGGNARHVLRQYAEENALARGRGANAAGTEEFGGGCLRGRYNNLREVIQNNPSLVVVPSIINAGSLFVQRPICRTNYLPNNSMAGATGGVLPTNWSIASLPAGITVSYSASGTAVAADGTSVNYIDVTVSGTAGATGFLNIRPNLSSSTIAAFVGQSWNTSVYLQLISGSVASVSPTWQLQELNSSQGFLQGSNITGLGSLSVGGPFERYNVSRVFTDSATAFVTCRWGHGLTSGTAYNYTIRIGSPQLERFSVPTPMIATSTGAVTRLNESTNVVGLPPEFSVSRNTTATRVNSSGLIESVASGVPRIDWLGQSCPGLLVEPSAQNLAFHSESWVSGNNWTLTDATNVTGATSAPNGNATANALSPTAASGSHFVFSNGTTTVSYTSGTIYTQSAFFKAGTGAAGQFVQLTFPSARFTQTGYANFDLIAGTVSVVSGSSADANRAARIENYGDGWYRCIFTATCNSTGTGAGLIIALITSTGSSRIPSFSGVTGDVLYGWGAQVETGSVATTYIPTTTAAVSRAADVISASGALVSSLIGQTEGVLYCEFTLSSISDVIVVPNAYNSAQNYVGILHNGTNSLVLRIRYRSGGSNLNINFTQVATIGTTYKVAIGYKSGDSAAFVNGVQVGSTDTTAFAFENPLTLIEILVRQFYSSALFGPNRIRAVALYTTRLSNDQLAELTRL